MSRYISAANEDLRLAISLYGWNQRVGAELFILIGTVEVVLRNSIHRSLSEWQHRRARGESWFDSGAISLDRKSLRDVDLARQRILAKGREITDDRLVSELGFGFWRYLMTARYRANLWPIMRQSFAGFEPGQEAALFARVGRLHEIRNRIAHHEPIFGRRLDLDHRDCLLVLGAVCPVTAQWAEGISRIPEVLANTPLLR